MFSTLDTKFSLRRQWPFGTALLTQCALLALLLLLGGLGGGRHRAHIARASAHPHDMTDIYFQPPEQQTPPPAADSQAPELAELTPAPTPVAKPAPAADDATRTDDAKATDEAASGDDMTAQLWEIDAEPETMVVMQHTVSTAQPIFTPEPPILRHNPPASERGKDVVLEVLIAPDGSIATLTVVQGVDYDAVVAIAETLKNWRFEPAKFAGHAVPSRRQLSFHFPG